MMTSPELGKYGYTPSGRRPGVAVYKNRSAGTKLELHDGGKWVHVTLADGLMRAGRGHASLTKHLDSYHSSQHSETMQFYEESKHYKALKRAGFKFQSKDVGGWRPTFEHPETGEEATIEFNHSNNTHGELKANPAVKRKLKKYYSDSSSQHSETGHVSAERARQLVAKSPVLHPGIDKVVKNDYNSYGRNSTMTKTTSQHSVGIRSLTGSDSSSQHSEESMPVSKAHHDVLTRHGFVPSRDPLTKSGYEYEHPEGGEVYLFPNGHEWHHDTGYVEHGYHKKNDHDAKLLDRHLKRYAIKTGRSSQHSEEPMNGHVSAERARQLVAESPVLHPGVKPAKSVVKTKTTTQHAEHNDDEFVDHGAHLRLHGWKPLSFGGSPSGHQVWRHPTGIAHKINIMPNGAWLHTNTYGRPYGHGNDSRDLGKYLKQHHSND